MSSICLFDDFEGGIDEARTNRGLIWSQILQLEVSILNASNVSEHRHSKEILETLKNKFSEYHKFVCRVVSVCLPYIARTLVQVFGDVCVCVCGLGVV